MSCMAAPGVERPAASPRRRRSAIRAGSASLATYVVGDLLQEATVLSAAANLMAARLEGFAPTGIASLPHPWPPGRSRSLAVSWIAEGAPAPMRAPPLIAGPTAATEKDRRV